jgi:uncharacterized damage-inducible protein DinB
MAVIADSNLFVLLAEYNQLMCQRQYAAVATLPSTKLHEDKGAFFKLVLGAVNHMLIGNIIWLKRFSIHPSSKRSLAYFNQQESPKALDVVLYDNLSELKAEREKADATMIQWVSQFTKSDLNSVIAFTHMAGACFSKSFVSFITYLFLHQVHYRGQTTTLL